MKYSTIILLLLILGCEQTKKVDCSSLVYTNNKTYQKDLLFTGDCNSFYTDSRIKSYQKYVNGIDDGEWIFYYENGSIQTIGEFDKGKRIGEWKYFYENGKIKQESFYDSMGNKAGSWKLYDPDGDLDWVRRFD